MDVSQLDSLGDRLIQLVARMQFPQERLDIKWFSSIAGPAIGMANIEFAILHDPGAILR
jgi:hypothetical protein